MADCLGRLYARFDRSCFLRLVGDRMTTRELSALIGKEGLLSIHPIRVAVRVLDSRVVYSRVDCLVTPIAGIGNNGYPVTV